MKYLYSVPGILATALALTLFTGCGTKEPELVTPTPHKPVKPVADASVADNGAVTPPPAPGAASVPVAAAQPAADAGKPKESAESILNRLNFMVAEYNLSKKKQVHDLHEFVELGYLTEIPTGPAGERFRLDPAKHAVVMDKK